MSRAKHTPAPPMTDTQVRDYWRGRVIDTALRHASTLEWLEPMERDIRKLAPHIQNATLGRCHELLDKLCSRDREGCSRVRLEQDMNAELWNFMKQLAPSKRFPAHAQNDLGFTAELFQPHSEMP